MSAVSLFSVKSDFSAVAVTHHRPPPPPPPPLPFSSLRFPSSLHIDGGASISRSKVLRVCNLTSRLRPVKCSSSSSTPSLGMPKLFPHNHHVNNFLSPIEVNFSGRFTSRPVDKIQGSSGEGKLSASAPMHILGSFDSDNRVPMFGERRRQRCS